MVRITATIITHNEEDRIAETISSLACCDEVLVVDSGSTDRTGEIAGRHGARVIAHGWEGYANQKNFAASQAENDWILSIDSDERPSAELAAEIRRWKRGTGSREPIVALSMPRLASYEGRWIRHSGWYPDRKIRLYHRGHGRWQGDGVHERLVMDGHVASFTNDLLHFPYRCREDHLARIDCYTQIAAETARREGARSSHVKVAFATALAFLRSYVFKRGFLDGRQGWTIARLAARYVLLREMRILRSWNGASPSRLA